MYEEPLNKLSLRVKSDPSAPFRPLGAKLKIAPFYLVKGCDSTSLIAPAERLVIRSQRGDEGGLISEKIDRRDCTDKRARLVG